MNCSAANRGPTTRSPHSRNSWTSTVRRTANRTKPRTAPTAGPAADDPDPDLDHDPDAVPAGPLGDIGVLADLGLSEKQLLTLRTDALVEIADALGAAEVLETVR